jgi:hypothetical protein
MSSYLSGDEFWPDRFDLLNAVEDVDLVLGVHHVEDNVRGEEDAAQGGAVSASKNGI